MIHAIMKKLFQLELKVPLDKYRGFNIKYIGMLMLIIINFLEARELSKQSERLSRYKKELNNGR